ncbi:hypothetical protein niasHS_006329 [Heterodera schachtii]|uniref:Single-stranded DNA-binding protein, mitochondrial n=2 Tax=Heterodera TaxID=34509 RepID=A0ABD2JWM2_HETSC
MASKFVLSLRHAINNKPVTNLLQSRTVMTNAEAELPDNAPKRRFINRGINRVELLGGVGGQPVVKQTAQGSAFASFNLYTNVDRRLSSGGTMTSTEVHNVIAFGGMARYVEKNVERGTRVYLTGRLHYTGGQLNADGSRSPRICSVNLESIYPLSKPGAMYSLGGGGGASTDDGLKD